MELGNLIFGNSRGEFEIPRTPSWEGPWEELCEELKINWYGFADEDCLVKSETHVLDTPVFTIRSYCWGDCDCGAEEQANKDPDKSFYHRDTCCLTVPNFLYKPTGFSIKWYKYPFRDSYSNQEITPEEWRKIIKHCIDSVKND